MTFPTRRPTGKRQASRTVFQSRGIDQETALGLARSPDAGPDLLWRYLDYLVCQQGNAQPELHTELALQLAQAALQPVAPGTFSASP